MSAVSDLNVYRVPGKLIKGPSGSSPSTNYGGTILGAVTGVWFDVGTRYVRQNFDELGRTGEVWSFQDDAIFRFQLRAWDSDALGTIFPSFSSSAVNLGGYTGPLAETKGVELLFAPENYTNHPAIRLYNAVPEVDTTERGIRFSIIAEMNISVNFVCLPLASNDATIGKLGLVVNIF